MTEGSPESGNETRDSRKNSKQNPDESPNSEPEFDGGNNRNNGSTSEAGSYSEPDETPTKEYDKEKLQDFFKKKGTVEILAQLAEGPKRFSVIDDALTVSHGTVANRLTDGIKLDLWREYITYPDDGGKIKLYELEPEAEHLAMVAKEENIDETTEQKRAAYAQHEAAISNFRNRIKSDE